MHSSLARDSWTSFRNDFTDKSEANNLPLKWAMELSAFEPQLDCIVFIVTLLDSSSENQLY